MRWMIASDIHGSALWCARLLEAFDREGADRLLLLGDVLYHGPRNALPGGYAPMETAALLNARRGRVLGVRGNCDAEIDQAVLQLPLTAEYCLLTAGERTVFATHGHVWHRDRLPPLCPGDILLQGHTHVPSWDEMPEGVRIFNPGSVSIPKNGTMRGYLLLEDARFIWKTLDGEEYHRFDA